MNGIKRKIILNYCIIIFMTIFVLESFFIFYIKNYYYDSAKNFLLNKAKLSTEFYNKYMAYDPFEYKIRHIYKNLILKEEETRIQVIDNNQIVLIDSYGFYTKEKIDTLDVKEALKGNLYILHGEEGLYKESIMAVSVPLKFNEQTQGILRYSISLEKIKKTIRNIEILAIISGLGVSSFVLIFSLILARSIVEPISELKNAANEMAKGNYKIRHKKISNDEIGELAQTFNYMAEEIEKTEKIKNEFISSISHELRTPLTSIKGWSETLSYGSDKEEVEMGLNIIKCETDRLIRMVEELLDFSKIQGGKIEIILQDIDIKEVLKEVINQFKVKLGEKNIITSLHIQEDLPYIQGDRSRLKQVFINLIENALKFTGLGGSITINCYKKQEYIFIEIEDNGEGIEKENISRVTEKFFQENSNKSGSGLGLSISSEIVKLHGGYMEIYSQKDIGTKVKIGLKHKGEYNK